MTLVMHFWIQIIISKPRFARKRRCYANKSMAVVVAKLLDFDQALAVPMLAILMNRQYVKNAIPFSRFQIVWK